MSWTMPIRQASYRGVNFEVLSVEDAFDKAIMEHSYPFVNGADLEDMGLNPRVVKLQAIFRGEGYFIALKKLLKVLQHQGGDVLMHPVLGRLPNMVCYSASIRHEADFVNYATLDLNFKEAAPGKPIFVFNHSVLNKIDSLLQKLDALMNDAMDTWASMMEVVVLAYHTKSTLLSQWDALCGCVDQLTGLLGLPRFKPEPMSNLSKQFIQQSTQTARKISGYIHDHLLHHATASPLNVIAHFNEVIRQATRIEQIPSNLVSGRHNLLPDRLQGAQENTHSRPPLSIRALQAEDIKNVACLMQVITAIVVTEVAVNLLESYQAELAPREIEYITEQVRLKLVSALDKSRELNTVTLHTNRLAQPMTTQYAAIHKLSESMRDSAHQLTQLAIAAINQKPPLVAREVAFDGTIHQIAHAFYGDYRRAKELLRLNPQIRYPHVIKKGEILNGYLK